MDKSINLIKLELDHIAHPAEFVELELSRNLQDKMSVSFHLFVPFLKIGS